MFYWFSPIALRSWATASKEFISVPFFFRNRKYRIEQIAIIATYLGQSLWSKSVNDFGSGRGKDASPQRIHLRTNWSRDELKRERGKRKKEGRAERKADQRWNNFTSESCRLQMLMASVPTSPTGAHQLCQYLNGRCAFGETVLRGIRNEPRHPM